MSNQITKEDILSFLRQQKTFLDEKFFVKKIGLFGSFVRNEAKALHVGVFFEQRGACNA